MRRTPGLKDVECPDPRPWGPPRCHNSDNGNRLVVPEGLPRRSIAACPDTPQTAPRAPAHSRSGSPGSPPPSAPRSFSSKSPPRCSIVSRTAHSSASKSGAPRLCHSWSMRPAKRSISASASPSTSCAIFFQLIQRLLLRLLHRAEVADLLGDFHQFLAQLDKTAVGIHLPPHLLQLRTEM